MSTQCPEKQIMLSKNTQASNWKTFLKAATPQKANENCDNFDQLLGIAEKSFYFFFTFLTYKEPWQWL